MNKQLIPQLDRLVDQLNSWQGRVVRIEESISRCRKMGHDRHFATRSEFGLRLTQAGIAINGSTLSIGGDQTTGRAWYEVTIDRLDELLFEDERIVLVERFEQETERRSLIAVLPNDSTVLAKLRGT